MSHRFDPHMISEKAGAHAARALAVTLIALVLLASPAATADEPVLDITLDTQVVEEPPRAVLRAASDPDSVTPPLSSYSEAVVAADEYLNAVLGEGFVSSHMELLGLDERPDIPSLWFVVYRYHSSGNSVDLSVAVDHGASPGHPSRIVDSH